MFPCFYSREIMQYGIWDNKDKNLLVWVNQENHMLIFSIAKMGK